MIEKPTVVELLEKAENRYSLVIATAKRARQISKGSKPMTDKEEASPVTYAADEIKEDKVKIYDQENWDKELEKRKEESKQEEYNEKEMQNSNEEKIED